MKCMIQYLLLLLIFTTSLITHGNVGLASASLVSAQEAGDSLEGEDDDVQVEMDEGSPLPNDDSTSVTQKDDEEEEWQLKPSPDVDTYFLFTKPSGTSMELHAGRDVQFLVGVTNKGSKDFVLETMDTSFRYPMDFTFYIQNFSTISYNRVVKPKQQATLYYQFFVSESFAARSFGLAVNLLYKDADGIQYLNSVFNETVNVVETDEGLDGETFFLYVFLAACGVLLLVGVQQLFANMGKKKPAAKPKVEMGTQNVNDVDYDWLPKETLNELNKSPRRSPRQRRTKRGTGSVDE
ncbi:translocon-associated protein subunit alpha-like [Limulus polyphemus]|uniref:Translocon-associated protein subunit alpha n=1 Tax=Limulus polyphemus TaxID=6850 RepID=A0ABM1BBN7_LIMPO|nr:translocon-associated protein subunit alpha-like [Limulus polyphemus]